MTVFVKSNFEIFGENTGFPKKSLLFVPEDHNDQVRTNIKYNILNAKNLPNKMVPLFSRYLD